MKKLFIALLISVLPLSAFANIMLELNVDTIGVGFDYYHDCFNEQKPDTFRFEPVPFAGVNTTVGWEFNSGDIEKDIHFFAGLNVGIEFILGLNICPIVGMSKTLVQFNNWNLELKPSAQIGISSSIFGNNLLYVQESLDFEFLKNSRTGFYGGAGITNVNLIKSELYVSYGLDSFWGSGLVLRIFGGVRI